MKTCGGTGLSPVGMSSEKWGTPEAYLVGVAVLDVPLLVKIPRRCAWWRSCPACITDGLPCGAMPSLRVQRRIGKLLDQAEEAADRRDWSVVAELTRMVFNSSENMMPSHSKAWSTSRT